MEGKNSTATAPDSKEADSRVSGKKPVGVQAFIGTFGANVLIQACTIVQGILVARMLGPQGRGELAAVTLWPTVFGSFGVAGIYIALGRIAAQINCFAQFAALIRSGIVFALLTSSISAAVCYVAVPWLLPASEGELVWMAKFFILVIPFQRLVMNLNSIDQGRGDFRQFNRIRSIMNPTYVLLLFLLWLAGFRTVFGCVAAMLAANAAPVMVWFFTAASKYSFRGPLYSLTDIFKQSIPFSLAGIFYEVYLHIDKALMLWFLGTRDLGIYTVALAASSVVGSVTLSAGMVSFTLGAQADYKCGFEVLAKTFRISLLLWVLLGGGLSLVMPWVLPLVYGSDFTDAVLPARLLIAASAFAGLGNMLEQAIRGQGRAYIGIEGRTGGLAVLLMFSFLLVKKFQIIGFCLASILGQLTYLLLILWMTNQHYEVQGIGSYMPRWADLQTIFCKLFKEKQAESR